MRVRPLVRCALAGAGASLALWALDLLALRELSFAGVADRQAQAQVVAAALSPLIAIEARLALLHAVFGGALGALVAGALAGAQRLGRRIGHRAAVAAAVVLSAHALALGGMMARYPQIYADRWWLRGGWRAAVQRACTHLLGPWPFDVALAALLLGCAGLAATAAAARLRDRSARTAAAALAALVALGLLAGRTARTAGRPPDVLVLVADSLRADRVESADVMPYTAARVREGTLYRNAFTPLARTFPSWVSLLTGREVRGHGIRTMFPSPAELAAVGPTFVSRLRDRGYRTFVVSDFAGDIFPRFDGGFEEVDAPTLTVDALARATAVGAHGFALPLLRLRVGRSLLPEWRNLASLSDPEWLTDEALRRIARDRTRPYAGVVFYSTAHFPYVAPYPDYRRGADGYRGAYLYHAPPVGGAAAPTPEDVRQIRARYDAALTAVDRALGRLYAAAGPDTIVVVMGDHGEELHERAGIAGHGDTLAVEAQRVPILLSGPGVASGRREDAQVRLVDLGATLLDLAGAAGRDEGFGDGISLFREAAARPLCVETDMWFWPDRPEGLVGRRLTYPGIGSLLVLDPATRQVHLGPEHRPRVESSKERGLVLGHRLWHERPTPTGLLREELVLPGVPARDADADLRALFETRCVAGDPSLARFMGAVVYAPGQDEHASGIDENCRSCGLGR
ncbi:MAG: sulfatase-like hydrolase/transferase [Vicinamibacteria bacterium]